MNEDLKFHKEGGFDIEILDIEQQGETIRVKTRCPYGEDSLGLSSHMSYLDIDGIPKWKKEVKRLLTKKYGRHEGDGITTAKPKKIFKEHIGKLNIEDLDKPLK